MTTPSKRFPTQAINSPPDAPFEGVKAKFEKRLGQKFFK
jgi:hypothetical protein